MAAFKSFASENFWKCYRKLPRTIQQLADKSFRQFERNPGHPGLQFKKVGKNQPVYSARVTDFYRALCYLNDDNVY